MTAKPSTRGPDFPSAPHIRMRAAPTKRPDISNARQGKSEKPRSATEANVRNYLGATKKCTKPRGAAEDARERGGRADPGDIFLGEFRWTTGFRRNCHSFSTAGARPRQVLFRRLIHARAGQPAGREFGRNKSVAPGVIEKGLIIPAREPEDVALCFSWSRDIVQSSALTGICVQMLFLPCPARLLPSQVHYAYFWHLDGDNPLALLLLLGPRSSERGATRFFLLSAAGPSGALFIRSRDLPCE